MYIHLCIHIHLYIHLYIVSVLSIFFMFPILLYFSISYLPDVFIDFYIFQYVPYICLYLFYIFLYVPILFHTFKYFPWVYIFLHFLIHFIFYFPYQYILIYTIYILYVYIDIFSIDLNWFEFFCFLPVSSIYKEDRHVALTARSAVNATWRY